MKFKLLKIVKKFIIKTWKMFFIIKKCGDFIKEKSNLLPTRKSFIFRDLNRKAEYLWSICIMS